MEMTRFLAAGRRWWWLVAIATLIGGASAFAVSRLVTPTYEATTTLLVVQQQEPGTVGLSDLQASERLANTFSELVTVRPVLQSAIARANLDLTPEELEERLTVNNPPTTQLLEITAEASTAEAARDIANVVADSFIDSNQSALGNRPGIVSMVESADAPLEPSEPNPLRNTLLGAVLALIASIGIVGLAEYMDDTVKDEQAVGELTGVPVIGHIRRFNRPDRAGDQLRAGIDPRSHEAEAYRSLRTNVTYTTGREAGPKRLLITSPGQGEGKSTTAANLAVVFGLSGARVVILDADLRRPSQHRIFGIPNTGGLTNVLASGGAGLKEAVQRTPYERVWILPSGPIPANPAELLESDRMTQLLQALEQHFDIVILDTPPTLAVTDPVILSSMASATIVVVEHGRTRNAELKQAVQRLAVTGRPIAGVVINGVSTADKGYYYGDYEPNPPTARRGAGRVPRGSASGPPGSAEPTRVGDTLGRSAPPSVEGASDRDASEPEPTRAN